MPDRICAGGASVRNYLAWSGNSKSRLRIDHRLLCRIICNPRRRMAQIPCSLQRAVIALAVRHARLSFQLPLTPVQIQAVVLRVIAAPQSSCEMRDAGVMHGVIAVGVERAVR